MQKIESGCVSLFINRQCPRRCSYCSVVNEEKEKKRLSVVDWKRAFSILESRGIEFFLILGTEPLLLGKDLEELVSFWKSKGYEYGLYTTSPRPLFDSCKDRLINAGLRNWSSGIDYIPEVYDRMKEKAELSLTCMKLVERERYGLVQKARDGLNGMEYMFQKGIEEQHVLITISRMNIEMISEMVRYLVDRFPSPNLRVAMNWVEYGSEDMDFAPSFEKCLPYLIREKDKEVWVEFVSKMKSLPEKYKLRIQIPLEYLELWDEMLNQNRKGNPKYCAMGIEVDGTLRSCGYRRGSEIAKYSVFDLEDDQSFDKVYNVWLEEIRNCKGCAWVFPYMLEKVGKDVVNYQSDYWKNRGKKYQEISDVKR